MQRSEQHSIVLNLFSNRILFLLTLVILLLAGFFLWGVLLPGWQASGGDFANYYTASRLVLEGVPLEEAYRDFGWFQQHMDRYGIQQQVGGFIPHPPSTALVLLPFAFFDAVTARRLWTIVNLLLAMVSVVLLSRTSGLHWLDSALIFLGSGYGLWNNFRFGQLYLLLLVSILMTLYLWRIGRPVLAGICLGALIPVKYVGLPLLLYFAWRRQWNLCLACVATILLVLGISLCLMDLQTFRVFLVEVLPRHLQGEIQDPYAVTFQTWSSLFRRLFLYEPLLNPSPVHFSPLLFMVFKNISFWIILSTGLLALLRVRFGDEESRFRFQIGWILLLLLLVSPASATYHFLLLTISTAFLVQILLSRQQTGGVTIEDPAYRRHLGLILHSPDRGLRRIVFSYCQLFKNRYSIFALSGDPWTKESPGNLYYPDQWSPGSGSCLGFHRFTAVLPFRPRARSRVYHPVFHSFFRGSPMTGSPLLFSFPELSLTSRFPGKLFPVTIASIPGVSNLGEGDWLFCAMLADNGSPPFSRVLSAGRLTRTGGHEALPPAGTPLYQLLSEVPGLPGAGL